MTGRLLAAVFRRAESLAARPGADAAAPTDAELVRRFAAAGDEAAFAALLHRHGPTVWGACRNLLPEEADAEDAFQATFLALVRGAGRVRDPAAVGAWLHGVAVRVCTQAKRAAARRRRREAAAGERPGSPPPSADWAELHAAVHEEVARLPARERAVFVLCGLGGARQPEAADRLGVKVSTVSGLLARARKRLLARLTDRGLAPAAAAATLAVGTTAAAAAPATLTDVAVSLARGGGAPAAVLELARGATEGVMSKAKLLAAAAVVAAALGVGTGAAVLSNAGAQPPAGGTPAPGPAGGGGIPGAGTGYPTLPGGPPGAPPAGGPGMAGAPAGMMGMGGGSRPAGGAWEYKAYRRRPGGPDWEKELNRLGADGWEVVCVTEMIGTGPAPGQQANEFLLKRRKPPAPGPGAGLPGMAPGYGGPGMPGGRPGPGGFPGGGGEGAAPLPGPAADEAVAPAGSRRVTLKHLRVTDLTPELRKQFSVFNTDERANAVYVWADTAPQIDSAVTLLTQLDAAAGKARR